MIREPTNDSIEMRFTGDKALVLTDDVKFKFYCSTVSSTTGLDLLLLLLLPIIML